MPLDLAAAKHSDPRPAAQPSVGPRGEHLAILLGIPRSGTTLLGALLANHPAVVCPPEPWVLLAAEALGRTGAAHPADAGLLATAIEESLGAPGRIDVARRFAAAIYDHHLTASSAALLIDKTPRYYHILPFIDELFPAARYLLIDRNPLDVAASYQSSWGVDLAALIAADPGHPASLDLILGPRRLRRFAAAHPGRVERVRYEELVARPQDHLQRLVSFLGLPASGDLTRLGATLDPLRGASMGDRKIHGSGGVHGRSVGAWRSVLRDEQLQPLLDALGAELLGELAGATVLDELAARGAVDRGSAVTEVLVGRAEALLERRWDELRRPPAWSPGPSPEEVAAEQEHIQQRLRDAEGEAQRLRAEREELHGQVQQLGSEVEEAAEQQRRWQELSPRQQMRQALRQAGLSAIDMIGQSTGVTLRGRGAAPMISVIVPAVEPAEGLQVTLESIVRQPWPRVEVLVVAAEDDETIPRVCAAARGQHQLTLITTSAGAGRIDALNRGLDEASGDVLTWIDPGDALEPDGLARAGAFMQRRRRAQAAYFDDLVELDGWRFPQTRGPGSDLFSALAGEPLPGGGIYIRRDPFQSIRQLDAARGDGAEYALWLALTRYFRLRRGDGAVRARRARAPLAAPAREAIADEFRGTMRPITSLRRRPRAVRSRAVHRLRESVRPRRWWYPLVVPEGASPPPAQVASWDSTLRCPNTGRPFDRLLHVVPDHGGEALLLRQARLCTASGVALIAPAARRAHDDRTEVVPCAAKHWSPYRGWRGGRAAVRAALPPVEAIEAAAADRSTGDGAMDAGEQERVIELLRGVAPLAGGAPQRLLHVGDGGDLDQRVQAALAAEAQWTLAVLVPDGAATPAVEHWRGLPEDAPLVIPDDRCFDLVHVAPEAGLGADAPRTLRRLSMLLAAGGRLVVSLPNLDAAQLELFGPTWSLWHHPGHAMAVRRRALPRLARACGLEITKSFTWSDALTTARSLAWNSVGLGGCVPQGWRPGAELARMAVALTETSRQRWDPRGRGVWSTLVAHR